MTPTETESDWFDLDSDDDGCSDAEEAGFTDPDNDGLLCASPVSVDYLGRVVCTLDDNIEYDTLDADKLNLSWSQNEWYMGYSSFVPQTSGELSPGYFKLGNGSGRSTVYRGPHNNTNAKVDLTKDFILDAKLYLGDDEDDRYGIAFNINNETQGVPSYSQEKLMAMKYNYALSVEFDTYDDQASYDLENDHASLHINGNNIAGTSELGVTQNSKYSDNAHGTFPIQTVDLGQLEDGEWKDVTFFWNASLETFVVKFEGEVIISYKVDLIDDVFYGNTSAWFGFTSGMVTSGSSDLRVFIKGVAEGSSVSERLFDGYSTPNDLDEDGIYDFKEYGDTPEFSENYEDDEFVIIKEGEDSTFVSSVTS